MLQKHDRCWETIHKFGHSCNCRAHCRVPVCSFVSKPVMKYLTPCSQPCSFRMCCMPTANTTMIKLLIAAIILSPCNWSWLHVITVCSVIAELQEAALACHHPCKSCDNDMHGRHLAVLCLVGAIARGAYLVFLRELYSERTILLVPRWEDPGRGGARHTTKSAQQWPRAQTWSSRYHQMKR